MVRRNTQGGVDLGTNNWIVADEEEDQFSDPQIILQREREEALDVFPFEKTGGDIEKDEEIFEQSNAAKFAGAKSDLHKQEILTLVVSWPRKCKEVWNKGPNFNDLCNVQSIT